MDPFEAGLFGKLYYMFKIDGVLALFLGSLLKKCGDDSVLFRSIFVGAVSGLISYAVLWFMTYYFPLSLLTAYVFQIERSFSNLYSWKVYGNGL